jgi:hypothetical protein
LKFWVLVFGTHWIKDQGKKKSKEVLDLGAQESKVEDWRLEEVQRGNLKTLKTPLVKSIKIEPLS